MQEPPSATGSVTASGVLLRVLADVLWRRGIAPHAWLNARQLDTLQGDPQSRQLPLAEYEALFAEAIRRTGDEAIGLHCGFQASESSFGLFGPLVSHAQSLRTALELIGRFHPLILGGSHIELLERADTAQLRVDFPRSHSALDRILAELMLAGLMRALLAFGCTEEEILGVHFPHAPPRHLAAYREIFAERARFAQAYGAIDFARDVLDRRHLHHDPTLQRLVHTQAEQCLERLSTPAAFVDRLRALLRRQPSGTPPNMASAARELGLSERSLRRRLSEEGTSYRDVVSTTLRETACTLLRNPRLSLQDIAASLGFADAATFHRAFKRWTKQTPLEYRATASTRRA